MGTATPRKILPSKFRHPQEFSFSEFSTLTNTLAVLGYGVLFRLLGYLALKTSKKIKFS